MVTRNGSVTIGTIAAGVTIIGAVMAFGAWMVSYVNTAVAPVEAQEIQDQTDIATINANVSWIKAALQTKGFNAPDPTSTYGQ
jgi:hypothetical protein